MDDSSQDSIWPFASTLAPEELAFIDRLRGENLISQDEMHLILNSKPVSEPLLNGPRIGALLDGSHTININVSANFYYYIVAKNYLMLAGLEDADLTLQIAQAFSEMARMQGYCSRLVPNEPSFEFPPVNMSVLITDHPQENRIQVRGRMGMLAMEIRGIFRIEAD